MHNKSHIHVSVFDSGEERSINVIYCPPIQRASTTFVHLCKISFGDIHQITDQCVITVL